MCATTEALDGAITPKVIGRQAFIRHSPISVARLLGKQPPNLGEGQGGNAYPEEWDGGDSLAGGCDALHTHIKDRCTSERQRPSKEI